MFRDRKDAGERLAEKLAGYRGQAATLLLALPRGGVPVAAAAARVLALPVDVLPVHKIGAPSEPELAVGAVAADGLVVLDEETIATMYISRAALEAVIAEQRKELLRRERLYRGDRAPLKVEGQKVILIDDGLATGYTMLAAARAVRQLRPARVVVAVPVAPKETLDRLAAEADEVVCVLVPSRLVAVGQFYQDFSQVSDAEVQEILRSSE
ncbi:MAG TPA: phosphoribosyltransferase family protein [Edaphobacter sp.]|nr:phosphoribosyltransferase family protein [Edaphobacter sp.]